jgi:hypothetical protein
MSGPLEVSGSCFTPERLNRAANLFMVRALKLGIRLVCVFVFVYLYLYISISTYT